MSEESHEVEASKEMDTTLNNTVPEAPNDNDTTMEVEKEIASPDPPLIDSQLKENVPSIKMEDDSGNFESQVLNDKTEKDQEPTQLPANSTTVLSSHEPMETEEKQQTDIYSNSEQTDTYSSAKQTDTHSSTEQTGTHSSTEQTGTHSSTEQMDTHSSTLQTDNQPSLKQMDSLEQPNTHSTSKQINTQSSLEQTDTHSSAGQTDAHSSSKDKVVSNCDSECETIKDNNDVTPPAPPRQTKGSKTTPFSSIIRTRRTKIEEKVEDNKTVDMITTAEIEELKGKTKSGRGRGSLIRRIAKAPEPKIDSSPVTEGDSSKSVAKDNLSPSSVYRVTRATAAAAGLKTDDFLQLPWQQKKRRRVGGSGEEGEENESKKPKEDEEETVSEEESGDEEQEATPTQLPPPPPQLVKSSTKGRGRGRGKRGGGGGRGKIDVPLEESPHVEEEEIKKRKTTSDTDTADEMKDSSVSNVSIPKKKRGRPKRKGKETPINSPSSPPLAPSVKVEQNDDMIIKQETSPTVNDATATAITNEKEGKESKAVNDEDDNDIKKGDCGDKELSSKNPPDSGTPPITSETPPTNIPVESGYPFPRYSLEDQGYTHTFPPPPHPLHHSFLPPHSYPPFSAPPYHTFMIPTSPHFPPYPPPPQDCLAPPPHQPLYFSEDPFNRYPPHSTAVPHTASTTATNGDKASTPTEPAMTTPTNPSHPGTPTISTPVTHTMPLPHPLTYTPSHITPPTHHPGYPPLPPPHFGPPMIGNMLDWNMAAHQISAQGPPTQPPAPPPPPPPPSQPKAAKEPRFPIAFHQKEETQPVSNPVNCPECGRHFKNNKALNGHMRLHGGFDWTKRICRPYVVGAGKKDEESASATAANGTGGKSNDKSSKTDTMDDNGRSNSKQNHKEHKFNHKNNEAQTNKSKDKDNKESSRPSATLDDLCRAAEELERIERDSIKPRPSPLVLPHERRITSFSPPYTPPPILSPARSLVLLSGSAASAGPIPTPGKIWPQRKGSDNKGGIRDLEEPFEPKINIGNDFQATIPDCTKAGDKSPLVNNKETLVWEPITGLTQEDEDTIDGYLELACSPAVPFGGRNKELALHLLKQVNGSVKEAVRLLVMGKSLLIPGHEMNDYNYTGNMRWSAKERQQFRRAWRVHRKQFNMLQSSVETKSLPDIIEYYYFWKKYCPDEYRGRNRHLSDELLSDEEDEVLYPSSTGSNSTTDSNDADTQPLDDSAHLNGTISSSASKPPISLSTSKSQNGGNKHSVQHKVGGTSASSKGNSGGLSDVVRDISRGFNNAQPPPINIGPLPNQEHRCKYPGCNQVYSSIFALNGHIRIHGGSWYPKKFDVENTSDAASRSETPVKDTKKEEDIIRKHQLEIAKTMVTELAQPRSPSCSLGTLTPSPKPSPGRGKSSLVKSKKACSSSPADRDGFYPCNRCGRVFQKVKSRSAHMKSHIIKQVH